MSFYSPKEWIPVSILGLFTLTINGFILKNEMKKRKAGNATFLSKFLSFWSFLCILFGVLKAFGIFALYLDGFCYFMWYCHYVFGMNQSLMMGFYQLSRLSYCFSKNEMYPNNLFISMYTIGAILILNAFVLVLFGGNIPTHCGINQTYIHYVGYLNFESQTTYRLLSVLYSIVYLFWDVTTLFLYTLKIHSFKKLKINPKNIDIYTRILSTLHKILIITLFYEITVFILFAMAFSIKFNAISLDGSIWYFVHFIPDSSASILYSYSAYIMLEHNNSEYIKFLKIISFFKLDYLCCCYKYIVSDQLKARKPKEAELETAVTTDNKNNTQTIHTTHVKLKSAPQTAQKHLKDGNKEGIELGGDLDSERTTTSDLERYAVINKRVIDSVKNAQ